MEVPVNDGEQDEILDKEGGNWACPTVALVHIPVLFERGGPNRSVSAQLFEAGVDLLAYGS